MDGNDEAVWGATFAQAPPLPAASSRPATEPVHRWEPLASLAVTVPAALRSAPESLVLSIEEQQVVAVAEGRATDLGEPCIANLIPPKSNPRAQLGGALDGRVESMPVVRSNDDWIQSLGRQERPTVDIVETLAVELASSGFKRTEDLASEAAFDRLAEEAEEDVFADLRSLL